RGLASRAGLCEGAGIVPPPRDRVQKGRDALLRSGAAADRKHHKTHNQRQRDKHLSSRLRDPVLSQLAQRETGRAGSLSAEPPARPSTRGQKSRRKRLDSADQSLGKQKASGVE